MKKISILKNIIIMFVLLINISSVSAKKIHNLITISGIKNIQLIGYGLVAGLPGTGDDTLQIPFTCQSLNNMLIKLGIYKKYNNNIQTKNVAAVIVTAIISPWNHIGKKIDVTVSSIGNASSLNGGTLLMTPLQDKDKKIYAVAQGNISMNWRNIKLNHIKKNSIDNPTQKKIIHGAIIEKSMSDVLSKHQNGIIFLKIKHKNWQLLQKIYNTINMHYFDIATIIDRSTIEIIVPKNRKLQNQVLMNIMNINISIKNL
ncbi:Flagellar P-ring protein [Buchnera aphidicola (Cinara pseudotaxifoliae)]|uniref:Flagellar P-ring protein, partial n=1 Tax=Buchnera aphidicola (Cinara pseudotaxifoliae) TaxID=655384 RepID=A0A451DH67_9GAMM|nr:flagellar basal body P-ring protein FlgI [Buchnera aphidicola]VFP85952.1 Flagellar P-ring protein [Buchnera aphidicola (Cinara pseudotaxifoliae)]